jgi:hypothetical protein
MNRVQKEDVDAAREEKAAKLTGGTAPSGAPVSPA